MKGNRAGFERGRDMSGVEAGGVTLVAVAEVAPFRVL